MENQASTKKSLKSKAVVLLKKITFGKILKFFFIFLIITVYILLFGRMWLARTPGAIDRFVWTDDTLKAYNSSATTFIPMTQQLPKTIDDNGYYSVSDFAFLPEYGQIQFTVRYNNSTKDALKNYYTDVVDEGEIFVFTITDENGNVYDNYKYITRTNLLYNFRRVVFDDLNFDNINKLNLNIYYINDVTEASPMYKNFVLYDSNNRTFESKIEIKSKANADNFNVSPAFRYIAY